MNNNPLKLNSRNLESYNRPITEQVDKGTSLYLHGKAGSGKTTLALQLTKELYEQHSKLEAYFLTFGELVDVARSTFNDDYYKKRDSSEALNAYKKADVLIVDDLGSERQTDFSGETLYNVINYRYNERLATFITSNYSLPELAGKYHERIISRIAGLCKIVKMSGVDYRLKDNNKKFVIEPKQEVKHSIPPGLNVIDEKARRKAIIEGASKLPEHLKKNILKKYNINDR